MFVSVIMPTYNNVATLKHSVPSLLNQKTQGLFDYEVIVVDDGSKPKYKSLRNINILRNRVNKGKGYSIRSASKYAIDNNYTHNLILIWTTKK